MLKCTNKKNVTVLFVLVALMQFGSIEPMLSRMRKFFWGDLCERPSKGVKITDLSLDCLCEICEFYIDPSEKYSYHSLPDVLRSLSRLSLICKKFREAVQERSRTFVLDYRQKKKIDLSKLDRLYNVRGFVFERNDSYCTELKNLQNLHYLELYSCDGAVVASLKDLRKLVLSDCPSFIESGLKELKYLHTLTVEGCNKFTGKVLRELPALQTFKIANCAKFNVENLKKLENLRMLIVQRYDSFTDEVLENLENLHTLHVWKCKMFTGSGLENTSNLQTLRVECCEKFNGEMVKSLKNLQTITMCDWKKFDWSMLKELKKLRDLHIAVTKNHEQDEFDEMGLIGLTSLQFLWLENCKNFTGKVLKDLNNVCHFKASSMNNINPEIITMLKKNRCKVEIVYPKTAK